ncbi:MAG: hypothetical protein SGJ09_07170 [Phycisphaerae bacterium]|nr:hypothetical protein [Phycisphaerae bacterium]
MILSTLAILCALGQNDQAREDRPPPPILVWPDKSSRLPPLTRADLSSLRRLVVGYDFEDAERFPRELPPNWYRVLSASSGRPGYPDFGSVGLSDTRAHGGRWSLEAEINGGSVAVALPPGLVRIFPASRYRVTCWLQTAGLERAMPRVVVRYYGRDGKPTGEEFVSGPVRADGVWKQVTIDLPEIPRDVTDLALELEVAQPSRIDPLALRRIGDDIHGSAWFDDLEVWQVPVIRFATDGVGQIFASGKLPAVNVGLHDLVSDELTARVTIVDIDGSVVNSADVRVSGAGGRARVPLGVSEPGWYRASLEVLDASGSPVARRELEIAVLNQDRLRRPHSGVPDFGVLLPAAPSAELPLLGTLVHALDPDFALLPMWTPGFDVHETNARIDAVRTFVDGLLDARVEPVLAIESVPNGTAIDRHVDQWQALLFFGATDKNITSLLEPWLFAFGQHVSRWQIGAMSSPAAREDPNLVQAAALRVLFDGSVASPIVLLPAQADCDGDAAPAGVARHIRMPWAARPGAAGEYAKPWAGPDTLVSLELAPSDVMDDRTRVDDLGHRTLDLWREGAQHLAIDLPMHAAKPDGTPASLMPEAIAWRQLSAWLSARTFGGELALGDRVAAWLVKGAKGISVLAWSTGASDARADGTIEISLGNNPLFVTDLMGRTRSVEPQAGSCRIALSESPVLIEGVDSALVTVLAAARFEPALLESRRAGQTVELVLRNPFGTAMSGTISVPDRPDWTVAPRQQVVSIAPGGEQRIPFRITLPRSTVAGEVSIGMNIDFTAAESYRAKLLVPVTVDWPDVEIASSWRFAKSVETGHIDLIVTLSATNRSNAPLDLEAFAVARDYIQNRKPILKLSPGATATRVFQFADGARKLSGANVFTGVNDLQGDRRLSASLEVPPLLPRRRTTTAATTP